jgi:hypothetical protein
MIFMKKILLGTIILTCFAFSMILTQVSCQKSVAQVANGNENLILFVRSEYTNPNSQLEIWISNIDGTNQRKVPITLPSGLKIGYARLTENRQTIIFEAYPTANTSSYRSNSLYSCSLNGSNLTKIVDANPNYEYQLQGAY